MAQTDRTRRDGETAGGDDCGGATTASAEAERDSAGKCGHDGAGEGDCLSHGCAAVSQSALRVGARSQARRDRVAAELQTSGQARVTEARALCARAATEAGAERDAEVAHLPGPRAARYSAQSHGERHGTGPAIVAVLGASSAHLSTAAGRQAQALQHASAGSG